MTLQQIKTLNRMIKEQRTSYPDAEFRQLQALKAIGRIAREAKERELHIDPDRLIFEVCLGIGKEIGE